MIETREQLVERALWHLRRWPVDEFPRGGCGAIIGEVRDCASPASEPIYGRACVAYSVLGYSENTFRPTLRRTYAADFTVVDLNGVEACVMGAHAEVSLKQVAWTTNGWYHLPPGARRFFPGPPPPHLALRLGALRIGDRVVVCGQGSLEADTRARSGDYRTTAPSRLVLRASADFPLAITNIKAALRPSGKDIAIL